MNEDDTLNELLLAASLRHQVSLRRYANGEVKKVLRLLEKSDKELTEKLRKRLAQHVGKPLDLKSKRLQELIKNIRETRAAAIKVIEEQSKENLRELAKIEAKVEVEMMVNILPVSVSLASPAVETLIAATLQQPFAGGANSARTLKQWFSSLQQTDQQRIIEAIQLGLSQGESIDDIVKRVVGTKSKKFSDGILAITRRNAEAVVRTATNHVSNAARNEVWKANEDIVFALKWTSTLDGRTSAICRARDGALTPVGNNVLPKTAKRLDPASARPPAHPNCRSVMVAVFSEDGVADAIGERPFVRDTRTNEQRQLDFRKQAQEDLPNASAKERNEYIKKLKQKWARENVGRVPQTVTYNDWLKKQPADFQDEVLGKGKGKLFREGKYSVEEFVDKSGKELTLDELKR